MTQDTTTAALVERAQRDLKDIEREITQLQGARQEVLGFLHTLQRYAPDLGDAVTYDDQRDPELANAETLADALVILLERADGPMRVVTMIEALRQIGRLKGDERGHYGTLAGTLKRKKDLFVKKDKGEWDLKSRDESDEGESPVISGFSPSSV